MKLQLAGLKERLHVEFKVDLDVILDEERNTRLPLNELQEKTDRMKKRLENMGEINSTAIEACTEMKKGMNLSLNRRTTWLPQKTR